MRTLLFAVPALLAAGAAAAQGADRPDPLDPQAKVPPVEYRSAFESYRPFLEQELADWRKSNDEVGANGGHAGHRPGPQTPEAPPGTPQGSGHGGHHP